MAIREIGIWRFTKVCSTFLVVMSVLGFFQSVAAIAQAPKVERPLIGILALPRSMFSQRVTSKVPGWLKEPLLSRESKAGAFSVEDDSSLQTREYGYEQRGALVFEASEGNWYQLRKPSGEYGWVQAPQGHFYLPYPELLLGRLTYLVPSRWNRVLFESPETNPTSVESLPPLAKDELPVRVLEVKKVQGRNWIRLSVYSSSPCSSLERKIVAEGWIPALQEGASNPVVWFWSRGC